jgi:hypothetical protein
MSTGQLHRHTGRLHAKTGAARVASAPLFTTPLPPFHVVFPAPGGKEHPLFELHRAANRIYHERRAFYKAKGAELAAPELVAFIREDVVSNMTAVMKLAVGPVEVPYFAFLNPRKLWAWFPPHQEKVAALVLEFRKLYKRRRRTA